MLSFLLAVMLLLYYTSRQAHTLYATATGPSGIQFSYEVIESEMTVDWKDIPISRSGILLNPECQGEWIPLTRSMLKNLGYSIWQQLEEQGHSGRTLASLFWAEMGAVFEDAVLQSLGMSSNLEEFNGTVPDAVGRILNGKLWQGWPKAIFIEVKISTLIPSRERDRFQILRMIEYLRQVTARVDVVPALILITPSGGFIKEEIIEAANHADISLLHAEVQANSVNQKVIRVGPAKPLNRPARGIPILKMLRGGYSDPAGMNL